MPEKTTQEQDGNVPLVAWTGQRNLTVDRGNKSDENRPRDSLSPMPVRVGLFHVILQEENSRMLGPQVTISRFRQELDRNSD